ncbi:MAG: glutaredoxin family protein [Propioniciclava sp.]
MHPALSEARVVVLVRQGCHLCDDAETVLASVCAEAGVTWHTVDVDADAELRAAYTDHVPVTFVDGAQHAQWFLDADRLRAALR